MRQPRTIKTVETPAPAIAVETVKAGRGKRVCPGCNKIVPSAAKVCPECNAPRPEGKKKPKTKKTPAAEAGKVKPGRKPKTATGDWLKPQANGIVALLEAAKQCGGVEAARDILQAVLQTQ